MNTNKLQQISINFNKSLSISLILLFLGTLLFISQNSSIPQPTTKAQSSYPQCQQGRITSPCQCGNQIYNAGFCCYHPNANSGIWFDPSYEDILPNGCPTGNFYFVDQNNPNASDENPGTEELPWKTLIHGCAQVKAGDILLVKNGVYYSQPRESFVIPGINIEHSGTESNPIVIKAYPGHRPIIDGSTTAHNTFGSYLGNWIIVDGFIFRDAIAYFAKSSHITIQNCEFIRGWTRPGDPGYVNMICFKFVKNSIIRNCIFRDQKDKTSETAGNTSCIILHWCDDITVEHNEFYNVVGAYCNKCGNNQQQGYRNIFKYNYVHDSYRGIYMGGYDGASTDNKIVQNIFANISFLAGHIPHGNHNLIIANNIIYNCSDGFMWRAGDSPNNKLYNNIFYNTTRPIRFNYHVSNFKSDNNCFYLYDCFQYEWSKITFLEWQSIINGDKNSTTQDPKFINPPNDFYLRDDSLCLNTGIDVWDYDGDGNTTEPINMGAYITGDEIIGLIDLSQYIVEESQPNSCVSQNGVCCNENQICQNGTFISSSDCGNLCCTGECVSPSIPGDLNQDNKVNSQDFQILIQKFKETQNIETEDLNSDGIVDVEDIGILMHYWTN